MKSSGAVRCKEPRLLSKLVVRNGPKNDAVLYFTSTFAPASSNFFLMVAASSLLTPSLTVLGAPSTRSLASFKPRLVTSRTALMTLILLPPTSVSTTVNSVFSSAGAAAAAPPPPPPATTVAAAAETPNVSSIFFTRSDASSSVRPLISSRIVSTFDMTCASPLKFEKNFASKLLLQSSLLGRFGTRCSCPAARTKFVCLHRFAHHHRGIARERVERNCDSLRRSVQQEHDLADQFFLRGEIRELLDLLDRNHAAFDDAGAKLKRRDIFCDLGQRLGERNRIGVGIRNRIRAAQILEQPLSRSARAGALRQGVLDHLIFAAGSLNRAPQLGVVFDGDALES